MAVLLSQRPVISEGDTDVAGIDYTKYLDEGESLTGTPTVTEIGVVTSFDDDGDPVYTASTDLSFANLAVNDDTIFILRKEVLAGRAALFKVSGQDADKIYLVRVSVSTTSTPARTKVVDVLITVT